MIKWEKLSAVIFAVLGILISIYSYQDLKLGGLHSPGAGFLPFYCGASLIVLGVILFVIVTLKSRKPVTTTGENCDCAPVYGKAVPIKLIMGIIAIIIYAALFERVGFLIATVCFMVVWQKVVEKQSILKTAIVTICAAGGLYMLFVWLLRVPLPIVGKWFE